MASHPKWSQDGMVTPTIMFVFTKSTLKAYGEGVLLTPLLFFFHYKENYSPFGSIPFYTTPDEKILRRDLLVRKKEKTTFLLV